MVCHSLLLGIKIEEYQDTSTETYFPVQKRNTLTNSIRFQVIMYVFCMYHVCTYDFIFQGRKDPHPVDVTGSYSLPQIHVSQRCMELWDCSLGGDVLWRETILGNVQSGCKYL